MPSGLPSNLMVISALLFIYMYYVNLVHEKILKESFVEIIDAI